MGCVWFVKKLKWCCAWFRTHKKRFAICDPESLNSIPDVILGTTLFINFEEPELVQIFVEVFVLILFL